MNTTIRSQSQQHWLDQLQAGLIDRHQFRSLVIDDVYSGLHHYCQIPDGYQHCELASRHIDFDSLDEAAMRALLNDPPPEIVNPYPAQITAIELFTMLLEGDPLVTEDGDPLRPTIGAYLYGPPGTGKTHLMAAYGRQVKRQLDGHLTEAHTMMGPFIDNAIARYNQRMATEKVEDVEEAGYLEFDGNEIRQGLSPAEAFWRQINGLKQQLIDYAYKPTDLIYIGFKELFEVCKYSSHRDEAMAALEAARIVFIDDVHPQGDPEQVQLVLHLLERRYEMGRTGTFLTTNLQTSDLGGGDPMLGSRLLSRTAEMLLTIDFSACEDWRQKVKARRVRLVENKLAERVAAHRSRD